MKCETTCQENLHCVKVTWLSPIGKGKVVESTACSSSSSELTVPRHFRFRTHTPCYLTDVGLQWVDIRYLEHGQVATRTCRLLGNDTLWVWLYPPNQLANVW